MNMNRLGRARRQMVVGLLAAGLCVAMPALADGLDSLTQFMKQARSGRAQFSQVVTSPSKAGQPPRVKTSSGRFEFQRPGKFRFDYRKPFVQTLVADGQMLWLHDVDLKLLRVFATIVKCGGFSAAQAALNAGQSTISEQMSHLETRLGVKLCQRGRSGFRLPPGVSAVSPNALRIAPAWSPTSATPRPIATRPTWRTTPSWPLHPTALRWTRCT